MKKQTSKVLALLLSAVLLLTSCASASIDYTTPEVDPATTTRSMLEQALTEVAFSYFLKGAKLQYDSMELSRHSQDGAFDTDGEMGGGHTLGKYYNGAYRNDEVVTPEDATSDISRYSVCSHYVWNVYNTALGYPLLGHPLNAVTSGLFRYTEFEEEMIVLRWMDSRYNGGKVTESDKGFGCTDKYNMTTEEVHDFLRNYEENLRPGDIFMVGDEDSGHALIYVGGGYVLDCTGGKYNLGTGKDDVEALGAVKFLHEVIPLFVDGTDLVSKDYEKIGSGTKTHAIILRPLNVLCIDDGDSDPGNDKLDTAYVMPEYTLPKRTLMFPDDVQLSGYGITNATATRLKYPGMEIDRTVDITPYGTAEKGENLTYSVKISNMSNNSSYKRCISSITGAEYTGTDYEKLVVTEKIPAGTEIVKDSISNGGKLKDGTVTWTLDIKAGESVELTYSVKVTADIGTTIVSEGGYVDKIPSTSISNRVGGAKLSGEDTAKLLELNAATRDTVASQYGITGSETGEELANKIYSLLGIQLNLPTAQELLDNLFTHGEVTGGPSYHIAANSTVTAQMYQLAQTVSADWATWKAMMVDGYVGGTAMYYPEGNTAVMKNLRTDYLEAGDILVYIDLDGNNTVADRNLKQVKTVLCLGDGNFAYNQNGSFARTNADNIIMEAFTHTIFFVLRPSQAVENISG